MLHSSAYRNPEPFRGKNVLVVGCGSSGMEIAHDLATGGAAKVCLAVRTPPNILLRSLPGGLPGDLISRPLFRAPVRVADAISHRARLAGLGDLSEFGLPVPDEGVFSLVKRLDQVPALVDMDVIDAVKDGSIEVTATVESFDGDKVSSWTDPAWMRTPSCWPRATGVVWSRWSGISACSTRTASPSPRGAGGPHQGCAFSATTPGRR
jgi:hypothetical protein